MKKQRILYISYNGLLSHLGESQILPYLRELAKKGFEFFVVTFEEAPFSSIQHLGFGMIHWYRLRRSKGPTLFSILRNLSIGVSLCLYLVLRYQIRSIHARSYIPGTIALIVKVAIPNTKYLFDMRGFMLDEYLEGGLLKNGSSLIRMARFLERSIFRRADHVITLTQRSVPVLRQRRWVGPGEIPITTIPCCVDLTDPIPSRRERKATALKLIYCGSVGTWYALQDMVHFFEVVKKKVPDATFTILSPQIDLAKQTIKGSDLAESIELTTTSFVEVRDYLSRSDVGLLFYKNGFSRIGTSPIKFAEYMAAGIPVVATSGIGDLDGVIEKYRVGVILRAGQQNDFERACDQMMELMKDPCVADRCRSVALELYNLDEAAKQVEGIYLTLSAETSGFGKR